jgi:hypothetical protein
MDDERGSGRLYRLRIGANIVSTRLFTMEFHREVEPVGVW